jgi:hypothetical protein
MLRLTRCLTEWRATRSGYSVQGAVVRGSSLPNQRSFAAHYGMLGTSVGPPIPRRYVIRYRDRISGARAVQFEAIRSRFGVQGFHQAASAYQLDPEWTA